MLYASGSQTVVCVPPMVRESLSGCTPATSAYLQICEDIQLLKLLYFLDPVYTVCEIVSKQAYSKFVLTNRQLVRW